ncbi:Pentatricopeptide repeat-containing protein, chloroplastic/mitochondrial [Sesamum alatum]|uniref:Pentatricopeptide repeat-containing protein, chloroplastic/mitochondrial n=1 Tax=Sesamum alatum TaxID=300844 RepID=A0AAE2CPN6_9LAMI|nr:Pentatricopeptide repeat-containing protein, chloroplastic/mitochondrial [Sesamum alatum]
MATVLVTGPPAEFSTAPRSRHHDRLLHILTQSATVSIPQLKQIHAQILRTAPAPHHSPETLFLCSRLIHFSSLQDLTYTLQLFGQIPNPNTFIYNTLIRAYAHSKDHKKQAFPLFQELLNQESLLPDKHTFPGLAEEGRRYFDMMINEYKVEPVLQHFGCLIDLLARNGQIAEALDIVSSMPMKPDAVIWRSLLDASYKQSEGLDLSEEMARQIMAADGSESSGVYVLLSRVYASANRWNEVGLVRKLMADKGVSKEPGCSSIEINGIVHEFFAGDTTHPKTKEIYQFLDVIEEKLKLAGYVPDFSQAPLVDEADDGKGRSLRLHSERLAIAFGLLNSKPGAPIRVFKNLRVCRDCHNFTKLISQVYNVEIIMRDRLRFHCFKNGSCSCMDFW